MSRIAEIDQELAFHSGTSGARAAVDATRDDLVFWKDFLGSTAEDLKGATETIESTVEDLKDGSLTTGPTFTSEEVTEALDGDDSSLSEWIKAAQEKTDGIVGDFVAAGDVTPESLEEEIEEFTGTFTEVIEGLTETASGASSGLKELLERDDVKKHIEQLQSGAGAASDIAGGIDKGIKKIDKVLESLQNIDDLTSDDAATQLNAAADLFDELVGLFGDSITMIPGLGAFLSLYGKAFRGAAHSAGVIQGIADRNNRLYQIDRPGRFLWITSESLRADRIKKLKNERYQMMDVAMAAATQERIDRSGINYVAPKTDREVAVEL
ncbi:MAG: hypothetical protein DRJ28_10340 [Actinobacteria bacterium]|nr:MAG: hypothetical protein DRJ28_10340 [Actinomycetota bacterium]